MKALVWHGTNDVRVERVPDPRSSTRATRSSRSRRPRSAGPTCTCYDGFIPTMETGDILGHEFMGEVVEVGKREQEAEGRRPRGRAVHDRLRQLLLLQQAAVVAVRQLEPERLDGGEALRLHAAGPVRLLAPDRRVCRRPGASTSRVPFADVGPLKIPDGLTDEQVLFLSDIFPTGYMAAENCDIQPGDTVAVWGCGPVGQFAIKSALLLGAERVIAIDRRARAPAHGAARRRGRDASTSTTSDVFDALQGDDRRPRARRCIDAVGLEAHGATLDAYLRPGEDGGVSGDRSAARAAPGDQRAAARAARSIPASTAGSSTRSRSAPRSRRG